MTVEFVVAFPAMLAIAFVAVNAILFFSDCAAFDRVFRNAVCTYAASPAYEQGTAENCALIEAQLSDSLSRENLSYQVSSSGVEGGNGDVFRADAVPANPVRQGGSFRGVRSEFSFSLP